MSGTRFNILWANLLVVELLLFPSLLCGQQRETASVYTDRGNAYYRKGDFAKAITEYNNALRIDPKAASTYYNRANAYDSKGDSTKALADYNTALRLNPKYANAYNNRGNVYDKKGDYDKAITDFNEALRINPNDAIAYLSRGGAYYHKGDSLKALADYNKAILLDPKDRMAYNNRAVVYGRKGDCGKAIADSKEAMRLDPNNPRGYNEIAWILGTCPQSTFRDGKKAVEYATKACQLYAWKEPRSIDTLAAAYAEAGEFEQAIKWERKYLGTPRLPEKKTTGAKARLALYQAHKPYHADK